MSKIKITSNPSGGGTVTVQSPASTVDRLLTLPDADGVLGGWNSGAVVTLTTQTSVDFTVPLWAKEIQMLLVGVSTNGTSIPLVQLGDAGGIENTGYLGSGVQAIAASTSVSLGTTGMLLTGSTAASVVFHGKAELNNVSGNTWVGTSLLTRSDSGGAVFGSTSKTLSDVLTTVRLTTVNGTDQFDAGTVTVRWRS